MMLPELSRVEVPGMTRGAFILRGALATGALYGVGAVAPYVSGALGAVGQSDVRILEFALSLEQLESAFYKAALANAGLTGQAQKIATAFGAHEDRARERRSSSSSRSSARSPPPSAEGPSSGSRTRRASSSWP